MDSTDLSAEQWQRLSKQFQRMGCELQRLLNRMHEQKFPEADPLHKMEWDTHHALYRLQAHANEAANALEWKAKNGGAGWLGATQQPST
jgi:hypothetical protein